MYTSGEKKSYADQGNKLYFFHSFVEQLKSMF